MIDAAQKSGRNVETFRQSIAGLTASGTITFGSAFNILLKYLEHVGGEDEFTRFLSKMDRGLLRSDPGYQVLTFYLFAKARGFDKESNEVFRSMIEGLKHNKSIPHPPSDNTSREIAAQFERMVPRY